GRTLLGRGELGCRSHGVVGLGRDAHGRAFCRTALLVGLTLVLLVVRRRVVGLDLGVAVADVLPPRILAVVGFTLLAHGSSATPSEQSERAAGVVDEVEQRARDDAADDRGRAEEDRDEDDLGLRAAGD